MRRILSIIMVLFLSGILITGCELKKEKESVINVDIVKSEYKEEGPVGSGMYYQHWVNAEEWRSTYNNVLEGHYTTNFSGNGIDVNIDGQTYGWNMVSGQGWASGSASRVIEYSGTFSPDPSAYGDYQNAYLAVYGWGHTGNGTPVEYYVTESYGEYSPLMDDSYTEIGSAYTSNGSTYRAFYEYTNGPNIDGNGDFIKFVSIRPTRVGIGSVSGTVNFNDHYSRWQTIQPTLNLDELQIMATESYKASGSSDIYVSEGVIDGGGDEGFYWLEGKYVAGGSAYAMTGEKRIPANDLGKKNLHGLYGAVYFHERSGNQMRIEIILVPVDSATEAAIRVDKDPPAGFYDADIASGEITVGQAVSDRANRWNYNAADMAITAYNDWVTVSADGSTINLGNFTFGGRQLNNFVLDFTHISDTGIPNNVVGYSYSYTELGTTYQAESNIFVSNDPKDISLGQLNPAFLPKNAKPAAMENNTDYSFISAWTGKHVTVTNTGNNALVKAQPENDSWTSQDWVAEYVNGQDDVIRIKNIWTGKYLHAQANEENAKAVCYDLRTDWLSQQWQIEQTGFRKVRLKNLWTNRYLTVVDSGNYADIILKTLNESWTSQEWEVDWYQ